ncbi:MAG: 50S ribosomal protein L10 [Bradymonadaceae bacterium]|nr:50S ribosomal protein L10 [Lujinxingiaceae bacterium]
MNRTEKEQAIEEIRNDLAQAKSVILASHMGIDVNTVNDLRKKFRDNGVHYKVVKNTLAKIAIKGTGLEVISDLFVGPTAIAYSFDDAVIPAKVVKDFSKGKDKFIVRGGYLSGQALTSSDVVRLAELPSKDELRSQVLGLMQAVPSKFLRTLNAAPSQFLSVLTAQKQKLEEAA